MVFPRDNHSISDNLSSSQPEPQFDISAHPAQQASRPAPFPSNPDWSSFAAPSTAPPQQSDHTPMSTLQQQQHSAAFPSSHSLLYSAPHHGHLLHSSTSFGSFTGPHRGDPSGSTQPFAVGGNNGVNAYTHRRINTGSSIETPSQASASTGPERDELSRQMASLQPPTPTSRPSSIGPLRVHQHFPTMGETGVPVTILITVQASWAQEVGLYLSDGRPRTGGPSNVTSRANSHLVVSFGNVEVETRTERSMAGIDSPVSSYAPLDGQQGGSHWSSFNSRDLDLTVIANAPAYPGPPLQQPTYGGRVPIRIKLVGPSMDLMMDTLASGFEIGEFCYWQVSPRSNLKRTGDQLMQEHPLRRPASFPNFGTSADSSRLAHQSTMLPRRRPAVDGPDTMQRGGQAIDARPIHHRNAMSSSSTADHAGLSSDSTFSFNVPPPSSSPSTRQTGNAANRGSRTYGQEGGPSRPSTGDPSNLYPQLVRASQLYQNAPSSQTTTTTAPTSTGTGYEAHYSSSSSSSPPEQTRNLVQRANLQLHSEVSDMALGWTHDEWRSGRRLVQFWRKQEGATIEAICKPIFPDEYVPNSIVVSCIFWEVTNECYITSVDIIYLLEALVASRFNVEEKNRIRRNLEGLKPKTISKIGKSNDARINRLHEEFFKLVMSFPSPRPRHIEKDIKIFPWRVLSSALNKIIQKYSTAPAVGGPEEANQRQQQQTLQRQSVGAPAHQRTGSGSASGGYSHSSPEERRVGPFGQNHFHSGPAQNSLSIDVAASNSSYQPMHQGNGAGSLAPQQRLTPPSAGVHSTQPSPRRQPGSGGHPHFNFSDFVVSPVAFGQTPLQQSQQTAYQQTASQYGHSSSSSQQQQQAHTSHDGLGMDLGSQARD